MAEFAKDVQWQISLVWRCVVNAWQREREIEIEIWLIYLTPRLHTLVYVRDQFGSLLKLFFVSEDGCLMSSLTLFGAGQSVLLNACNQQQPRLPHFCSLMKGSGGGRKGKCSSSWELWTFPHLCQIDVLNGSSASPAGADPYAWVGSADVFSSSGVGRSSCSKGVKRFCPKCQLLFLLGQPEVHLVYPAVSHVLWGAAIPVCRGVCVCDPGVVQYQMLGQEPTRLGCPLILATTHVTSPCLWPVGGSLAPHIPPLPPFSGNWLSHFLFMWKKADIK